MKRASLLLVIGILAVAYLLRRSLLDFWYSMTKRDAGTPEMEATKEQLNMGKSDDETARLYASNAGFEGTGLDIIVAIAHAESGLDPNATLDNTALNPPGRGIDRGILQINSYWHSEVTDLDAYNPVTAFREGYRISKAGTDFHEWVTFTSGAYQRFLKGDVA
jgi:hypothetical protein